MAGPLVLYVGQSILTVFFSSQLPNLPICVLQVLLPAAGLLQLQDVKKTCCEFLESQLHPVNCLGIRAFADMHACTDLLNKANIYAGEWNRPQLSLNREESGTLEFCCDSVVISGKSCRVSESGLY